MVRYQYIYMVCGNTICVSTCQVEFVLGELSFFILLPRSRFIGCSGDFSVLKELSCFLTTTWAEGIKNWLGLLI